MGGSGVQAQPLIVIMSLRIAELQETLSLETKKPKTNNNTHKITSYSKGDSSVLRRTLLLFIASI